LLQDDISTYILLLWDDISIYLVAPGRHFDLPCCSGTTCRPSLPFQDDTTTHPAAPRSQIGRLDELPLKPPPWDADGNQNSNQNGGQGGSSGAAAIPDVEPSGKPPIPGRKPVKPLHNRNNKRSKGGRIVLADGGRAGQ
ncbi:MAG: hypothetical protein VCE75_14705, partial [Alphaproteobacteria bacterium]